MFIDLFIHSLVHLFIPLSVHSSIRPQPNIERRQAKIDLIATLSAKFQMNWRMDQMRWLTWLAFHCFGTEQGEIS